MRKPLSRKKGLLSRLFSGFGGYGLGANSPLGLWPFLPGSGFDYRTEAGPLWENSIVLAGISWIATTLPEAKLGVRHAQEPLEFDHPAAKLIDRPNEDYDGTNLWAGTILSLVTDGNSYWRKVRSRSGRVVELWYVPHFRIEPVWPRDGSAFLSGYRMRLDEGSVLLPKEDVVHLRHHVLDPMNERKGLAPLKAALREICTDNESATYTAALLRNSGVSGAMISPDGKGSDGHDLIFEKRQREDLMALWKAKFTGEHRGEPFVVPIPMKVQPFSFNPEQMLIDRVSDRPEERICALLNIPPVVLNLGTGLRNANTRASYTEARRSAYESNILPTQDRLARQLDLQLLSDFSSEGSFGWDRSAIEVLRESEDTRFSRAGQAHRDGLITVNEARGLLGLIPLVGGDVLVAPTAPERDVSN